MGQAGRDDSGRRVAIVRRSDAARPGARWVRSRPRSGRGHARGPGQSSLAALSAATGTGLAALDHEAVHATVVHGPMDRLPTPPVPVVRLHLARWQVGLGVAPRLKRKSLEALLRGKAPIVQRDPAAASQQALQRAAAKAGVRTPPPGPLTGGHIEAARLAALLGCAAITTEAAARAFDLRFLALEEHVVQIWLDERWRDHPGVEALGNLLAAAAFTGAGCSVRRLRPGRVRHGAHRAPGARLARSPGRSDGCWASTATPRAAATSRDVDDLVVGQGACPACPGDAGPKM